MTRSALITLLLVLLSTMIGAQRYEQDVHLWTGAQAKLNLPKRFDVSVQYQARFDNFISNYRGSYTYLSAGYSILKNYLDVGAEYRYTSQPQQDMHRFGASLTGKYAIKVRKRKLGISYRITYQREYDYFSTRYESGHAPTNYIRQRVQLKLDLPKRWSMSVSCEPFLLLSHREDNIDRVRSVLAADWEFVRNHHFNPFYLFQAEVNQKNPKLRHAIGLMYEWEIPFGKQKPKKKNQQKP